MQNKVYHLSKIDIRRYINAIANTSGIKISQKPVQDITCVADLYVQHNIDYVDAYTACWMLEQGIQTIYTFDIRHFKRISTLDVKLPS